MGRKSSIAQLPPDIREAVDSAIRSGRATLDEITLLINNLGAEASRSAVGRYVQKAEGQMKRYREAQEVAKVWMGRLESDPDGDIGRLLPEMLRTQAFQAIADLDDDDDKPVDLKALSALSRIVRDVEGASKLNIEIARLRRDLRAALAKIESAAGQAERDPEALKRAIAEAYGLT